MTDSQKVEVDGKVVEIEIEEVELKKFDPKEFEKAEKKGEVVTLK